MSFYRVAAILLFLTFPVARNLPAKDQGKAPVAEVGGIKITESEMRQDIGTEIYELESNLYQAKKEWIDQKIRSLLFEGAAKKAGLSLADWQRKEIEGKVEQPSEADIKALADQILQQQKTGKPQDEERVARAEAQARGILMRNNLARRTNEVYEELLKQQPVKILIKKPEIPVVDVAFSRLDPSTGPEKAPITIVAFSDFQCSYCRRGHQTLKEIEKAYPGKIRIVQREFPLSFHKRARAAAEAALCANEQGRFWQYADELFDNQQKLEDADLKKYAEDIKLDVGAFSQCVNSHKFSAQIDRDLADGERYGVRGTPAYFVNGRFISGAQPFENFKEVIDEELARKK